MALFKITSICKGGGYKYCRTEPKHPKANSKGLYPLHRVLMENKLGRLLRDDEDVHHKDEDKSNDVIGNLELKDHADHARHHKPELPMQKFICECGKGFEVKGHIARLRIKRSKSGKIHCSRSCGVIYAA